MYNNHSIKKPFKGSAAIAAYTLVKFGSADDTVSPAAAATDLLIGATAEIGLTADDVTAGRYVDVVLSGIAEVVLGGNVTRGAKVTSDANGAAIATTTASNAVAGVALATGVSGDVIPVLLAQGSI